MVAEKSVFGCAKTHHKLEPNGFSVKLEPASEGRGGEVEGKPDKPSGGCRTKNEQDKLRYWFDQFLRIFLKEICAGDSFQRNPTMSGNGQCVDLYKLFMVVREKGGYDAVSENMLWDSVAEESGLGMNVGSAVKLVYVEYLDTLEKLIKKVDGSKGSDCGLSDRGADLDGCLMELKAKVKGLLLEISDKEKREEVYRHLDLVCELGFSDVGKLYKTDEVKSMVLKSCGAMKFEDGSILDLGLPESKLNVTGVVKLEEMPGVPNEDKRSESDDVMIMDQASVNKESSSRKRKRESMWEILNWVAGIAKNPCDAEIGLIPERSKWKSHGNEEIWKQVLLVREAILLKRQFESSAEQSSWQSQKMHPSMYDDHVGATYNLRERLKCNKRLLSVKSTTEASVYSEASSGTQSTCTKATDCADKESPDSSSSCSEDEKYGPKRIPLGSTFQADVPEWTGMASESDPKWLGTQTWPSGKVNHKFLIERDPIGKGRQDSCGCQKPDSDECVGFHIAQKRSKVKLELGVTFNHWDFDKMGEEVKHSWTGEEEKKFRDVLRLNPPSQDKYFWDHIFWSFPTKSRADLVSYYFNVFLLRRRGYQNRNTPGDIKSDDDESDSVPLRKAFGHHAHINHPAPS
ncbi:AT-rich interactive domain protein [Quillaja saponaria]|nr:AT-rich interactive domain protein [Quillaja saponaria]